MGFFFYLPVMNTPLLKDVKLIVTDMDGTLLNNQHQVSSLFFDQFWALKEKGIQVVAASGRQHHSIIEKLAPIASDLTVISENGAMTTHNGSTELLAFPKKHYNKTLDLLNKQQGMHPVLCTNGAAFITKGQERFETVLKEFYTQYTLIDSLNDCPEEVLKIAIYHFESSEKYIYPALSSLERDLKIKISGPNWVDLSHLNANKGYALDKLQRKLGIGPGETMVFGDYNNDLEMMSQAHFSFAMENAHPNVLAAARYKTSSNEAGGVEKMLSELLKLI